MTIVLDGTSGITTPTTDSTAEHVTSVTGFKNRIINGGMVIDQRNAGASVTLTAANFVYPVDRMFAFRASGTSGAIAQKVLSGVTPNENALRIQRNSGDSATALLGFGQVIESNNCVDLASQSITMSFRARCGANFSAASSQITARIGTGNGTDQSAANFYNVAWTDQSNTNTAITLTTSFQTFSITISAGSSVNQIGAMFFYTPVGTASTNDWFEITGVQLEKGSVATSFDYRPYGTELSLCQRYYQQVTGSNNYRITGQLYAATSGKVTMPYYVTMRAASTLTTNGLVAEVIGTGPTTYTGVTNVLSGIDATSFDLTGGTARTAFQQLIYDGTVSVSAEL